VYIKILPNQVIGGHANIANESVVGTDSILQSMHVYTYLSTLSSSNFSPHARKHDPHRPDLTEATKGVGGYDVDGCRSEHD
jgi:hypothetical protein